MSVIGTVGELYRYPVKSMLGETIRETTVSRRGLSGDRVWALLDEQTTWVASAKLPRRWRRLLECSATYDESRHTVIVRLPDGAHLDPSSSSTDAAMSLFLDREVRFVSSRTDGLELERADPAQVARHGIMSEVSATINEIGKGAPEGGFFDAFPIHFLTTSSLERVAEVSTSKIAEPVRFRPNIVIADPGGAPFNDNTWEGAIMTIGPQLRLRVTMSTPRCAIPTLEHGSLGADRGLTMAIAELNRRPVVDRGDLPCLGAYAQVEQPGFIRIGDEVRLLDDNL